jgi:DNA repair protein RecO (recombination protein O)
VRQRQDEAYVLGTHELGEADLIVTLLSENSGRVRGVAASARRSRRRFGGALEPMTRVRARWVEKEGRELHRIESLETARSFASMQSDPGSQAACAVFCEVAAALAREDQADPMAFRLVGAVLEALEDGLDPWVAVRYFEFWMLRLHGLLADPSRCTACGAGISSDEPAVATAGEGVRCAGCARQAGIPGRALARSDRSFLAAAAALPPSRMSEHAAAARPGGALDELLRGSVEAFVERRFRTYRHLAAATRPHGGPNS